MNVSITFTWETISPLGVHTGLARAGGVDRAARTRKENGAPDEDAVPELPGEAVKAVIREAAERILRWRNQNSKREHSNRSIPTHPALARLFAPQWADDSKDQSSASYFFRGARGKPAPKQGGASGTMELIEIASTKIDLATGTAAHNTLRTVEVWKPGILFDLVVEGVNGDWSVGSKDRLDLHLLLMAIVCADAIGGGWSIGRGGLAVTALACQIDSNEFLDIATLLAGDPSVPGSLLAAWVG